MTREQLEGLDEIAKAYGFTGADDPQFIERMITEELASLFEDCKHDRRRSN